MCAEVEFEVLDTYQGSIPVKGRRKQEKEGKRREYPKSEGKEKCLPAEARRQKVPS